MDRCLPLLLCIGILLTASGATAQASGGGTEAGRSTTPELLGPGVISTDALEFGAGFSPSGDTVYFTRRDAPREPPGLLWSTRQGLEWSTPQPVSFGHPAGDQFPSVSADGRRLYFASARPTPDGAASGSNDLWFVERTSDGWSEARHLGGALSTPGVDSHPVQTEDGLYFHSNRPGGVGRVDAWLAPGNHGAWDDPVLLPFNADGDDGEVVLTPDGRSAILYSDRAGGFGRGDLYRIDRTPDGWGEPVNLGPMINTEAWEWTPGFTSDGRLVFARLAADGQSSDLYVVDLPVR